MNTIDLLVGLDFYFWIVSGRIKRGSPGQPVGVESSLSWKVCGPTQIVSSGNPDSLVNMIDIGDGIHEIEEKIDMNGQLVKSHLDERVESFVFTINIADEIEEADLNHQNEVYKRFQNTVDWIPLRCRATLKEL